MCIGVCSCYRELVLGQISFVGVAVPDALSVFNVPIWEDIEYANTVLSGCINTVFNILFSGHARTITGSQM